MYLWRPNDSEIENYRISDDIETLKVYIRKLYVGFENIRFREFYGMIIVYVRLDNELGFISKIEELKK